MGEVFHAFGIDWRLLIIEIFNFTLLTAALWYFLYTPVLKIIRERQQMVEKGVKDAEHAAALQHEAVEAKEKLLSDAESEAEHIVDEARNYAKKTEAELVAEANRKAEQILKSAEATGAEMKAAAERESEAEIAKLAILAAEKVLANK